MAEFGVESGSGGFCPGTEVGGSCTGVGGTRGLLGVGRVKQEVAEGGRDSARIRGAW